MQAPDQPVKVEPDEGVAVKVTDDPELKEAEQVEPQLIPVGDEVTVPEPVPDEVRVNRWVLASIASNLTCAGIFPL